MTGEEALKYGLIDKLITKREEAEKKIDKLITKREEAEKKKE